MSGFQVKATTDQDPDVQELFRSHKIRHSLPETCLLNMTEFISVYDEFGVYAVVGWRLEKNLINMDDFYVQPSRKGTLAAYATLHHLKELSESLGTSIATATPIYNSPVMRAFRRVFGVDGPSHHIYMYNPPKVKE